MSEQSVPEAHWRALCACGWIMRGPRDVVGPAAVRHSDEGSHAPVRVEEIRHPRPATAATVSFTFDPVQGLPARRQADDPAPPAHARCRRREVHPATLPRDERAPPRGNGHPGEAPDGRAVVWAATPLLPPPRGDRWSENADGHG